MAEMANRLDELTDRLFLLGGNNDDALRLREVYVSDPVEFDRLRRLNDVRLATEIAQAHRLDAEAERFAAGDADEAAAVELERLPEMTLEVETHTR